MGNRITALAPVRRPSQGGFLIKPKPSGTLLIQSLIDSIEDLKNTLAVRSNHLQTGGHVPPASIQSDWNDPQQVEVRQIQHPAPPPQQVKIKRSWLLDFFD